MSYLTLGSRGQLVLDPFSRNAQELFDLGLGKKKKFMKKLRKVAKKVVQISPVGAVAMVVAKHLKKKLSPKRRASGAVEAQEVVQEQPPVGTQYSYPSAPVDSSYSYEPPPVDQPPPAPAPVYYPEPSYQYQAPSPVEAAEASEYQYEEAPQRTGEGYTIEPGAEPWARPGAQAPGVEYEEEEGPPETSVEGGFGGYIVTSPSPAQRSSAHGRRSMAAALGQDEDFWYEPSWKYGRSNLPRTSNWPPSEVSIHRGSKVWGDALVEAMRMPKRAKGRRRSPALPFDGAGLGQTDDDAFNTVVSETQARHQELINRVNQYKTREARAEVEGDLSELRRVFFNRVASMVGVQYPYEVQGSTDPRKAVVASVYNDIADTERRIAALTAQQDLAKEIKRVQTITSSIIRAPGIKLPEGPEIGWLKWAVVGGIALLVIPALVRR